MDQLTIQHLLSAALPSISAQPPPSHLTSSASEALLSQDPPLSIPILSAAFRRFIIKVSPVFYVQDRVEEVLFWRRGWRVSVAWMAAWGLLCYYPRLFLALPHIALISLIVNRALNPPSPQASRPTTPDQDWQANLQGIQNLMLLYSEAYDALSASAVAKVLRPLDVPLSNPLGGSDDDAKTREPSSPVSTTHEAEEPTTTMSLLPLLLLTLPIPPLVSMFIPTRLLLLIIGWSTILAGHPYSRKIIAQFWKNEPILQEITNTVESKSSSNKESEPLAYAARRILDSNLVKRLRENQTLRRMLSDAMVIEHDPKHHS